MDESWPQSWYSSLMIPLHTLSSILNPTLIDIAPRSTVSYITTLRQQKNFSLARITWDSNQSEEAWTFAKNKTTRYLPLLRHRRAHQKNCKKRFQVKETIKTWSRKKCKKSSCFMQGVVKSGSTRSIHVRDHTLHLTTRPSCRTFYGWDF